MTVIVSMVSWLSWAWRGRRELSLTPEEPHIDVVVMEPSPGPAFSMSYCSSLGTGLLAVTVMPAQWPSSDLQTHWTVSAAADLLFSCVTFVWSSARGLNFKATEWMWKMM